ncbi:uncharacterized protein [Linepithema humile]|uniref:uncharacterized protein n=1 Tax=Linepithema humile TaxID=83485 RepID=UPI00351DD5CD
MEMERDLTVRAANIKTLGEFLPWDYECDEYLNILREKCRKKQRTGLINSLVAQITRLEGVRNTLHERFVPIGAGYRAKKGFTWKEIETAFRNRILTGAVINSDYIEPRQFLEQIRSTIIERIHSVMVEHGSVKINFMFNGEFIAGDKTAVKTIATKNRELFPTSDLNEWYTKHVVDTILTSLEEFQERDSGWALSRILDLTINVNKFNPLHAGCHIKLPREIMLKRAVVNVQSTDNACFAWAVVAALHPAAKHPERTIEYPHYSTVLNLCGIEFPMTLPQISKFEKLNTISVNVFTTEGRSIIPLRLTDDKKEKHVNLLYVPGNNEAHFVYIKDLSRLVSSQLSKEKRKKYICDRYLHYFRTSEKLSVHNVDCGNDCAVILPNEDNKWLTFRNYNRKERLPFVVYADLECTLEKKEGQDHTTYAYQHHKAFSVGYYVSCTYDNSLSSFKSYRGEDCVVWFVNELHDLARRVKAILTTIVPMADLTREESEKFHSAVICHVCEKPFAPEDTRVRDHCHLTGRYRGPAHSSCNLNYKDSHVIPVIFHNLSGYDAHFIIKDVANAFEGNIDLLPLTKERYISFTKNVKDTEDKNSKICVKLRFIDSFRFLGTSLEKLASYLTIDELKISRSEFSYLSAENFNLLTRKGVFPYEYVDSVDKLRETCLPPRESFYSSLTGETVSESDYAHATNVWQTFSIETLGQYSDLYLKTDVLLLADIFQNFRNTCIKSYGLDPAQYYTLPGYTWDAMLKHTRVKFELLTDIDMVLFVKRGIRGGLSQCSNRYARANNKYMPSYDPSKPSSYLMYFDVNNLYGWAMCQQLPYADFQWVENVENFDVMSVTSDSATGYVLEVNLAYPMNLHDAHTDLPFCPTRDKPPGKREIKLLATLCDKQRYVIHYRNLQQCIRHGLQVTKIHRILQFAQSPWLRGYIELNTQFRTLASNEFEKNLYKLMNNAVFGKLWRMCEIIRMYGSLHSGRDDTKRRL